MLNERNLVMGIHESPYKAVLAITGGGAEVIGELLKYGQGSNTLLEAIVPYDQNSFDKFIKGKPDKYCSPEAADTLAMAAFQRAISYQGIADAHHLIGVGVSCSLAKDNERTGRKHHAYVSIQSSEDHRSYIIDLTPLNFNREQEENFVAVIILALMGEKCLNKTNKLTKDLMNKDNYSLIENFKSLQKTKGVEPYMYELLTGQIALVDANSYEMISLWKNYKLTDVDELKNKIIFSGSFNPFHEGHEAIAANAYEQTGKKIDLEICVHNVDKPIPSYIEFYDRYLNLAEKVKNKPWLGKIYYTSLPTFAKKAEYFPGAEFIVGADTFKRIGDPKYGKIDEVVATLKKQNAKFLVFPRMMNGEMISTKDVASEIAAYAKIIPDHLITLMELSSSEIRKKNNQ